MPACIFCYIMVLKRIDKIGFSTHFQQRFEALISKDQAQLVRGWGNVDLGMITRALADDLRVVKKFGPYGLRAWLFPPLLLL